MHCGSCGSVNPRAGQRFCCDCGVPLTTVCQACGNPADRIGQSYCAECGTQLVDHRAALGDAAPVTDIAGQAAPDEGVADVAPAAGLVYETHSAAARSPRPAIEREVRLAARTGAELRRVSVLFVDLVGFTSWSHGRDPEDVRDLLSGYFEVARRIAARYSGVVEKFIGDAVMVVWGAPVAREDDPERAVRAALDLVAAVAEYGQAHDVAGLAARAGVVTGQVASWASAGEGLVTGDRVNTAARVQSVADPGTVLVDPVTRLASQSAISYEPAGEHTVKGKPEPLTLWRAQRVVGGASGTLRVDGLEAGLVARTRELSLIKDLFHAAEEGRRVGLVVVEGIAGVGKSRLGWEFEKYIDGLATAVWWHAGRCLSYGEGVAFWALADLVRQRFAISYGEPPWSASRKLAEGLPRWVSDPAERDFVFARLGVLVGVGDVDLPQGELFAGWRLFIERMAATGPVVWRIEDLHWADSGLLDFIEHLLEWSADLPIFVLAFARPELAERRLEWMVSRRHATGLHLDPLPTHAIDSLLDDLVPQMPVTARTRIAERAQGVPLFAVETMRSLIDRDLVVPRDGRYVLVGDVGDLEVPATLASLLASRLDGLPTSERDLVKALAVLGDSFPRAAVGAVTSGSRADVDARLQALVRKEILTVRRNPMSPDRGQYAFTQTMLRSVAYETLTKRERRARHLAVAQLLRATFSDDGQEVAEIVAAHYHAALLAGPTAADADRIRDIAAVFFDRAGRRARGVGAPVAAQAAFLTAAGLTVDEAAAARFTADGARMAEAAGRFSDADELYRRATAAHGAAGRRRDGAELAGPHGRCLARLGRLEEAVTMLRHAQDVLADHDPDAASVHVQLVLARALRSLGRIEEATPHNDAALVAIEDLDIPEMRCRVLALKGHLLAEVGNVAAARSAFEAAIRVARENGLTYDEALVRANIGDLLFQADLPGAAEQVEQATRLAGSIGDLNGHSWGLYNLAIVRFFTGDWDGAESAAEQTITVCVEATLRAAAHLPLLLLHAARGQTDESSEALEGLTELASSDGIEDRCAVATGRAANALVRGDWADAVHVATPMLQQCLVNLGQFDESTRLLWPYALQAAWQVARETGSGEELAGLLDLADDAATADAPPYLRAQLLRYRALFDGFRHACTDDNSGICTSVETRLQAAVDTFTRIGFPHVRAQAQLDLVEHLLTHRDPARSTGQSGDVALLLADSKAVFDWLGARPDTERLDRLRAHAAVTS